MPPKKTRRTIPHSEPAITAETLERLYNDGDMKGFLIAKDKAEVESLQSIGDDYDYLYPSLDDPMFNVKIAQHKEFYDTRYNGVVTSVKEEADRICDSDFELAPHQAFVRNFLSFQTPYNSLLLYHGLGSGKTCSAISVAEEMRDYMRQIGISQRIIIVAAPNIQDNFRLQLFDERKLRETDGYWDIKACVGNKLLREVNPMSVRGLPRDKVVSHIKKIINNSYLFLGYIEFANYIAKKGEIREDDPDAADPKKMAAKQAKKLRSVFNNRLVIIDEVHDIRVTDDNKKKRVALELMKLVKSTENLRLLLLSATPMYNSYKEIVWLVNLMNINDKRAPMDVRDVFDEDGDFRTDSKGREIGRELLERKATGYISFVRGENPYMFPFKIWPRDFAPESTLSAGSGYPVTQLNGRPVVQVLQYLQLYMSEIGAYQKLGYDYILNSLRQEGPQGMPNFGNMESFGYTLLQRPLEALNMVYPDDRLTASYDEKQPVEPKELVGKNGLQRVMRYEEIANPPFRGNFAYRDDKYGRIFAPDQIGRYSSKIKSICDSIVGSEGIVIVYSQYIDGGLVPVALALEELGITRYGSVPSLFAKPPVPRIDSLTFKPLQGKDKGRPATYVMITGDKAISPDNLADFIAVTNANNSDGSVVKVVLLSQAGGQGLDFSNIRQVHILEPWYNMNRAEQVIGRGVRSCSHKALPFEKRNVEIYMHGTWLTSSHSDGEEAADLYVYRVSEAKAVQIGRVSRVLKEIAVDCLLNTEQNNFTEANMAQVVKQKLSTGQTIDYPVGDKPYTMTCDYMETCEYKCRPVATVNEGDVKMDTYNESFIEMNNERILQRVRQMFKERHFYDKSELISGVNVVRDYPLIQINSALNQLVSEKNEMVTDKFGRIGRVVNIDRLYLFQPVELTNKHQSLFNRRVPLQVKRSAIKLAPLDASRGSVPKIKLGDADDDKKVGSVPAVMTRMESDFNKVFSVERAGTTSDDESWYASARSVLPKLHTEGLDIPTIKEFVIGHLVQELMYDEMVLVMRFLYGGDKVNNDFTEQVRREIERLMIKDKGIEGVFWVRDGKRVLLARNTNDPDSVWGEAESEDIADLTSKIRSLMIPIGKFNRIVGFMADFKNELIVFKVKQMDKKRHKGARCDQAGKKEAIATLNAILGDVVYTVDNSKDIGQKGICVIQEMILRLYDRQRKDDKVWFLPPGVAILNQIEKLSQ